MSREWKAVNLLNLAALTTSTQGSAVDLAGYGHPPLEMKAVFQLAGVAGTTPSITVAITECDTTNGSFAAPAQYAAPAAQTTNGLVELNFKPAKRYIRAEVTYTANTTSASIGCEAFVLQRRADS